MLATFPSKLGPIEKKKMSLKSLRGQIEDKSCQYRAITREFVYSLKMKKKKKLYKMYRSSFVEFNVIIAYFWGYLRLLLHLKMTQ